VSATRRRVWVAFALCVLVWAPGRAAAPPEPSAYRMDEYRAPTPLTLRGATVVSTEMARQIWENREAAFIDVLPQPPRPAGLPPGTLWHPRKRADIPGSIWLPDTGYGKLAPVMERYFARGLREATGSDRGRTILFYCQADCWMSWNAAKRALALGYTRVDWYPEGTNGWAKAGLPLEPRQPLPRPNLSE
jgi:PQQ-dependent catabolism-associated CXXCW motif protein